MPVDISTVKSRRHPRRVIQAPPSETTSESDSDGSVDDTIDEVSPPDVEPGIKINDNPTFALITLPPGITVSSYSAVVRHLEQSRFIFDAFRNVFGISSCCICFYWLSGWKHSSGFPKRITNRGGASILHYDEREGILRSLDEDGRTFSG